MTVNAPIHCINPLPAKEIGMPFVSNLWMSWSALTYMRENHTITSRLPSAATTFAILCALSGCQTLGLSAQEVTSPNGLDLIRGASDLNAAMTNSSGVDATQVAELGYSTVSDSCDLYFAALIKANNRLQLTKADLTSFGTAAAVISSLTGATPKVVGGTAALFGLAASVTSNFEQYAFATPFPVQTNILITKAMSVYAEAAPPSSMITIQQTVASVAGYARLCSFAGISALAQQAIAAGVPVNTAGNASAAAPTAAPAAPLGAAAPTAAPPRILLIPRIQIKNTP